MVDGEQEKKNVFSIDDFEFSSYVHAVYRDIDEYGDSVKRYSLVEHGNWNKDDVKDNFVHLEMSVSFKDIKDKYRLYDILELDQRAGEHISSIEAVWHGDENNMPYFYVRVMDDDLCEQSKSVPIDKESKEKLLKLFQYEMNKTDLDKFREHLDNLGEKWEYTDDSKTGIQCTYLNNGKPYQVYIDTDYLYGDRIRFENANNVFSDKPLKGSIEFEDFIIQETKIQEEIGYLKCDNCDKELIIHQIDTDRETMLVSDGEADLQVCHFEMNPNTFIDFISSDGNTYKSSFSCQISFYAQFTPPLSAYQEIELGMTKNDIIISQNNEDFNIFDNKSIYQQEVKLGKLPNGEKDVGIYSIYKIDSDKNAFISGVYRGLPIEPTKVDLHKEEILVRGSNPEERINKFCYCLGGSSNNYIFYDDIQDELAKNAKTFKVGKDRFAVSKYENTNSNDKSVFSSVLISKIVDDEYQMPQWCDVDKNNNIIFKDEDKDITISKNKIPRQKGLISSRLSSFRDSSKKIDIGKPNKEINDKKVNPEL